MVKAQELSFLGSGGSIPPPSTSDGLIIIIGIIELLVCEDR